MSVHRPTTRPKNQIPGSLSRLPQLVAILHLPPALLHRRTYQLGVQRKAREKWSARRRGWCATNEGRIDEDQGVGPNIPPTQSAMNQEIECLLNALAAYAGLSPEDRDRLAADVRAGRTSPKRVAAVRRLLAETIDGCDDEEIADALRSGSDED